MAQADYEAMPKESAKKALPKETAKEAALKESAEEAVPEETNKAVMVSLRRQQGDWVHLVET